MSLRLQVAASVVVVLLAAGIKAAVIGKATVTADQAPVMQGKETLLAAKKGDTFDVTEANGDWYGLAPSGGWIHKSNIRFEPAPASPEPKGTTIAPQPGPTVPTKVVVGVARCKLFASSAMTDPAGELDAGTEVSIVGLHGDLLQVRTAAAQTGWLRMCCLCSAAELARRQRDNQVPRNLACVGYDKGGSFLYGGSLSIVNNQFVAQEGDAFWLDPTMKGKAFTIIGHEVVGDPHILLLCCPGDKLARLPIATAADLVLTGGASPAPAPPLVLPMSKTGDATPDPSASGQHQLKEMVLDLGGGTTVKLVFVPAGKFMMGSPETEPGRRLRKDFDETQHEVTVSTPFYLGTCEVTQKQYEAVMGENPTNTENKDPSNPVGRLTWHEAVKFCEVASKKTGRSIRLPTEAEWEYASRAQSAAGFCFGEDERDLGAYAWHKTNADNKSHPVGQKKPNAWGIHDMHGNVHEWCADWYADYPAGPVKDPKGPATGNARIARGGSWVDGPDSLRSASRLCLPPGMTPSNVGFRVVMEVPTGHAQAPPKSPVSAGKPAVEGIDRHWQVLRHLVPHALQTLGGKLTKDGRMIEHVLPQVVETGKHLAEVFGQPDKIAKEQTQEFIVPGSGVPPESKQVTGDLWTYGPVTLMLQHDRVVYIFVDGFVPKWLRVGEQAPPPR